MQKTLFDDDPEYIDENVFNTEGIKYAGSKKKIIPYIIHIVDQLDANVVFDGFSGTTRVSQALKNSGYIVKANDKAIWSKIFGMCYLLNEKPISYYRKKIKHLNSLPGERGWYTEHYGGKENGGSSVQEDGKKKMWQEHNTKKLDAIREEIEEISGDEIEKSVLLTSLILALDKVDNTVGHQSSYVKEWSSRSYKEMKLEVPKLKPDKKNHEVYQEDIFDIVSDIQSDVAYYDPPYGSSNEKMPPSRVRYAAYYHLWKTICLDDQPEIFGAANRREDSRDAEAASIFEEFRSDEDGRFIVINALDRLIEETKSKYIILSYSNKGRATRDQIVQLLDDKSYEHDILEIDHDAHVMKSMRSTDEWVQDDDKKTIEYLFLISKEGKSLPKIQ